MLKRVACVPFLPPPATRAHLPLSVGSFNTVVVLDTIHVAVFLSVCDKLNDAHLPLRLMQGFYVPKRKLHIFALSYITPLSFFLLRW